MRTFYILFLVLTAAARLVAQPDTIYLVDRQAVFPGGARGFSQYWQQAFQVPAIRLSRPVDGEGLVRFTVTETGDIAQIYIDQPLTPELDALALKAVRDMPRWTPAIRGDKPVAIGYSVPYFLIDENGVVKVSLADISRQARPRGILFSLWAGTIVYTGGQGDYFNPWRGALGLKFGYALHNWEFGFEYDVFAISRVRKAFPFKNESITTELRIDPLNAYFPVGYRFFARSKWSVMPYVAPTYNSLDFDYQPENSRYESVATAGAWSFSAGLYVDKVLETEQMGRFSRPWYMTSRLRLRLNINPQAFKQYDTPALRGTAISVSAGLVGNAQWGKTRRH